MMVFIIALNYKTIQKIDNNVHRIECYTEYSIKAATYINMDLKKKKCTKEVIKKQYNSICRTFQSEQSSTRYRYQNILT